MAVVEIYTKQFCPFCWRALDLLAAKAIEFDEISVDGGGSKRELMIERANGRTTVPQIFIRGEYVGGCTELFRLEEEGRLDALLSG
ncbi:MAG: glutaredoxin 3 [Pseudomonadota bacterium]